MHALFGRSGNIIQNNYKILSVLINGEELELDIKFNEDIISSIINNLDEEWEDKFVDNSYYIDNNKLVIVKGKTGNIIDEDKLKELLVNTVKKKIEGIDTKEIIIPTIEKRPDAIDIEKIQKEIYKEAKDASYDREKKILSIHSNGVDLGVTIDEAKTIVAEDKEEYIIPLKITPPAITTDMLGEEAFPDKLRKFFYKI